MTSPPPRWATRRDPGAATFGPAVAKLGGALGTPFMPWQHLVADTALEVDPRTSALRYSLVVVTVPRQSGKTTLLAPLGAHECLIVPDAGVWLTAQKREDARDTWMEITKKLERSALGPLVKVRRANGSEGITWPLGGTLRPFAPGESALHGKTTRKVFVDEGWAFDAEQGRLLMGAIIPTQVTQAGAQVWVISTAGTARSKWLRALVEQGREQCRTGEQTTMAYFEWSIPEDADTDDLDVYVEHHPAVGHTITREALESARSAMADAPAEFARAYGNYWTSAASFAIAPALWDRARTVAPLTPGPVALAVETSADRQSTSIVVAGALADGRKAFEIVEHRGGIGWAAERVLELVQRHRPVSVVIDPMGPARPVWSKLVQQRRVPVPLADFGAAELTAAHTELLDGLVSHAVAHRAHERLDGACVAATLRTIREVEVISRAVAADGTSPAPLIAGMLALWGLEHPTEQGRPAVRS